MIPRRPYRHHGLPAAAFLDWDGTLREGFTINDWGSFLAQHGEFDIEAAHDIRARFNRFSEGATSYAKLSKAVPRVYANGLRGRSTSRTNELADEFVKMDFDRLFSATVTLLNMLESNRIRIVVISGSPQPVLEAYARELPLNEVHGVTVGKSKGRWNGELKNNPATTQAKREIVAKLIERYRPLLALGDSEADEPLFNAAQHWFRMDPNAVLAPAAGATRAQSVKPDSVLAAVEGVVTSFSS